MTEPERYAVMNGWLVENVGRHTCGAGTVESGYAHELGCGWEPIARVEQLLAEPGPRVAPTAIDRDALMETLRRAVSRTRRAPNENWVWNTANAILALVRPAEGVVVTPDEAWLATQALISAAAHNRHPRLKWRTQSASTSAIGRTHRDDSEGQ